MQYRVEGEREATLKISRAMLQKGLDNQTVISLAVLIENDLNLIRH